MLETLAPPTAARTSTMISTGVRRMATPTSATRCIGQSSFGKRIDSVSQPSSWRNRVRVQVPCPEGTWTSAVLPSSRKATVGSSATSLGTTFSTSVYSKGDPPAGVISSARSAYHCSWVLSVSQKVSSVRIAWSAADASLAASVGAAENAGSAPSADEGSGALDGVGTAMVSSSDAGSLVQLVTAAAAAIMAGPRSRRRVIILVLHLRARWTLREVHRD